MADDRAFFGAIAEARDLLGVMIEASRSLRGGDDGAVPAADSSAMRDLAEEATLSRPGLAEPVRTLFTLASFGLQSVEDHARSMCTLLEERAQVPVYSHVVLARAAAENAGRVFWLVSGSSTRVRVARAMNDQLYSLRYLARLPQETHRTNPNRRQTEILDAAEDLGFTLVNRFVEEDRPSASRVIKAVMGDDALGAALYNYQSAVAHGTSFGLLASVDPETIADTPLGLGPRVAQVTTASGVLGAFATVQLALMNAVEAHRAYFGWPPDGWTGSTWHESSRAAVAATLTGLGLDGTAPSVP